MKHFAAIDTNGQIASVRSSDTKTYTAACAIRWNAEDTLGVASYHRDAELAAKAAGPYRNRGAVETAIWEVVEITAKESRDFRASVKSLHEGGPVTQGKAYGNHTAEPAPQPEAPEAAPHIDPVKFHKLTKPMIRDMVAYLESGDQDITCHDGMTSKGLRSRGLMAEGEGRVGRLTPEGYIVAQALRG